MQTPRPQPSEPAAPPGAAPRLRGAPLVAALLLALPVAFVVLRCGVSNDVPFLVQSRSAPWIAAPEPVAGTLRQWGREDVPVTVFRRSFELREQPASALLRVRALRAFRVLVNGAPVPGAESDGSRWRDPLELELAPLLAVGTNELAVEVENPIGPALLSLRLDGALPPILSDAEWRVSVDGGPPRLAVLADDTRPSPEALAVETPAEALRERWVAVALCFVAGAAASLVFSRFGPAAFVQRLPGTALLAGVAAWGWLFARKLVHLPVTVGFDAKSHLHYVDWLATRGSVPLATDGWSMFHPPLFYALGAAVGGAGAESSQASGLQLKSIVFAAGLLGLAATAALARRLLPEDPAARALAVLFAAVLPVNLYSAAYVSNESLHTLLASLALLASVDVLLAQRPQTGRLLLLGALFGLAALTKFTVLVLLPVAFLFVALKLWQVDGEPLGRLALRLLIAIAPVLAIAGWFYLRNWQTFGDPLMANWGRMPGAGHTWWQQPGFHTLAYFARFGEALVHPYMAGFTSFWDSTYSTFWGDGFIGGRVYAPERHGLWSYDFMSIGYWLALPASAFVLAGAWRGVRLALHDPDPGRRAAFALLATAAWVLGLAYLYLTLRLAFFGQAKATYLLPLLTPLALWFALGFRALDRRLMARPLPRAALHGWLAAFAVVLYLGFAG
jgi:hypothetical protein